MPKGPQGQKRPGDVIGAAIMVGRIATGEIEDTGVNPANEHRVRGGQRGGASRATKLSSDERREIAQKAAKARWRTE